MQNKKTLISLSIEIIVPEGKEIAKKRIEIDGLLTFGKCIGFVEKQNKLSKWDLYTNRLDNDQSNPENKIFSFMHASKEERSKLIADYFYHVITKQGLEKKSMAVVAEAVIQEWQDTLERKKQIVEFQYMYSELQDEIPQTTKSSSIHKKKNKI